MTDKAKRYILTLIISIFIASIFALVIFPLYGGVKENSELMTEVNRERFELYSAMSRMRNFRTKEGDYEGLILDIESKLVDFNTPIEFIEHIENYSNDVGHDIEIKSTEEVEVDDGFNQIIFNLSTTIPREDLFSLIYELQQGSFFLEIQSLNINFPEEERGSDVEVDMSIKVLAI